MCKQKKVRQVVKRFDLSLAEVDDVFFGITFATFSKPTGCFGLSVELNVSDMVGDEKFQPVHWEVPFHHPNARLSGETAEISWAIFQDIDATGFPITVLEARDSHYVWRVEVWFDHDFGNMIVTSRGNFSFDCS